MYEYYSAGRWISRLIKRTVVASVQRARFRWKRTLRVIVDDVTTLTFTTEHPVSKDWFYPRYGSGALHEPRLTRLLKQELKPGTVFFDVGANLGWFTVLAQQKCVDGEIHAFELDPRLVALMGESVSRNDPRSSVFINAVAVSNRCQKIVGFGEAQTGNLSTNVVRPNKESAGGFGVGTISLDEYCEWRDILPDVVKIDIEGGEWQAVQGMRSVLQARQPQMVIEVHPTLLCEQGIAPNELVEAVLECVPTYRVFRIEGYRSSGEIEMIPWTQEDVWEGAPQLVRFM